MSDTDQTEDVQDAVTAAAEGAAVADAAATPSEETVAAEMATDSGASALPSSDLLVSLTNGFNADREAFRRQFEKLSDLVLDSAEVANKSAEHANLITQGLLREVNSTTENFNTVTGEMQKNGKLLAIIVGAIMLISVVFFSVMGIRMISRINQLDTMLLAVGKRAVELNAGLAALDSLNQKMTELADKQEGLTKSQSALDTRINTALKESEKVVQQVPAATAKQVAANGDALVKQVQAINSKLQAQSSAVQKLGDEVKSLKGSVGDVNNLKKDVQALVTLQKERYLEQLQRQNSQMGRELSVQYPRIKAKTAEATP